MKEGDIISDKICYILYTQISKGIQVPIFASLNKHLIEEKKKSESNSTILEVPFLEEFQYKWNDDFEPLGCHGCSDW